MNKEFREHQRMRSFLSNLFIVVSVGIMFLHCVDAALGGKKVISPVAAACATGCITAYVIAEELINSAEEKREREERRKTEHEQLIKDIEVFDRNDYFEKTGRRI